MNKKPADSKPRNATLLQSIVHGLPRDATHAGHWDTLTKALRRRRSERDVSLLHLLRDVAQMPGRAWPRCALTHHYLYPPVPQSPPSPPPQEAKPPRPPAPRSPRRPSQAGLQAATHLLSVCIGVPASTAARAISHPSFTLAALPHTYSPAPALSTTVSVTCARSGRGQGVVTAWSGRGQGVWVG